MDKPTSVRTKGVRRSNEEGRELARRWRASGLSASEFCRRNQVALHVLRYWALGKAGSRPNSVKPRDFFVVTAGDGMVPAPDAGSARGTEAPPCDEGKAVVIVIPLRSGAAAFGEALAAVLREVGA